MQVVALLVPSWVPVHSLPFSDSASAMSLEMSLAPNISRVPLVGEPRTLSDRNMCDRRLEVGQIASSPDFGADARTRSRRRPRDGDMCKVPRQGSESAAIAEVSRSERRVRLAAAVGSGRRGRSPGRVANASVNRRCGERRRSCRGPASHPFYGHLNQLLQGVRNGDYSLVEVPTLANYCQPLLCSGLVASSSHTAQTRCT